MNLKSSWSSDHELFSLPSATLRVVSSQRVGESILRLSLRRPSAPVASPPPCLPPSTIVVHAGCNEGLPLRHSVGGLHGTGLQCVPCESHRCAIFSDFRSIGLRACGDEAGTIISFVAGLFANVQVASQHRHSKCCQDRGCSPTQLTVTFLLSNQAFGRASFFQTRFFKLLLASRLIFGKLNIDGLRVVGSMKVRRCWTWC